MKKFNLLFYLIIFILNIKNTYSENISIIYTVDNEPITSVQIKNEIIYLKIINKDLDKMDDKSLVVYASKSLLREKIKEVEISKYFKFGLNDELVTQNIENLYRSLGVSNQDEFDNLLKNLNLKKNFIKKKIEIELLWNRLIYEKFKNKLSINKDQIKKDLKLRIMNETKDIFEYKLSEILFTPSSTDKATEEIEKIKQSINDIGFENTASIYSFSNTASKGGSIGWIKETQLSKKILKNIENLSFGEISEIIDVPSGKLILIVKDKRSVKEEVSFEKEFEKSLQSERNKQLNQFSSIYFRKVELNTKINEK
tara:strand:- start:262 stop:1197 length:936 start_codon:yes stop_codon:yes gene_type:complete